MEEWDIQYKELLSMPEQSYRLIDIRDEASMSYGMIPGAEWLPTETIEQNLDAADKEKKLVLYCTRGALSVDTPSYIIIHRINIINPEYIMFRIILPITPHK